MAIDWVAVATIAGPVIGVFVGVWANRKFENRPTLISYYGHVAWFDVTPPQGPKFRVNTHQVVVRNAGRRAATNVRLHHMTLPDFTLYPQVVHTVQVLPNGMSDVLIPTLVPGEQVTVSYLYLAPLTFQQINAGIKHDAGFAQEIPVLLQRQYPMWFNRLAFWLMLTGAIAVLYVLYLGAVRFL